MKLITLLAASVAVVAMAPVAATAATTVDLTFSRDLSGQPYNAFTQTFVLPTNYINASLNITSLAADDAVVASLNGTSLYGTGIFGPGNGNFYYTPDGASVPFSFAENGSGNVSFTAPFTAGTNTFTLFVNNNNAGINTGNGSLTGGPSNVSFVGTVTYDVSGAVPEPATWSMMLLGFGIIGFGLRARRPRSVRVTYA